MPLALRPAFASRFGDIDRACRQRGGWLVLVTIVACHSATLVLWGLVGSRAFVQRPPVPLSAVVCMLNLDMVARLNGRDLLIDGSMGDVPSRTLANSVARALGVPIDVPGLTRIVDVAEGIVRAAARRAWLPRQTSSITTR